MNDHSASKFRKRAILSAAGKGFSEYGEDLAHDVIVSWLEGNGKHQAVDQAVIDAIRSAFGRPGTLGYRRRRNIQKPAERMDALANHSSRDVVRDSVHDFERLIKPLESMERAVVCLIYIWGFKNVEIANLFGVDESCISQRRAKALSILAEKESER